MNGMIWDLYYSPGRLIITNTENGGGSFTL